MASLTLGIDLGPTSIGWALLDVPGAKLIASGVRVFPEGVARDASGAEQSKNEQRRIARGMRRQIRRRAKRKQRVRRALVEAGLLPQLALLERDNPERIAWERDQFRRADPYALRTAALTDRLDPFDLGRALLHLNQRRGFLSNRKTDRAKRKEASELLTEISALADKLEGRTLGQYLVELRGSDPARYHEARLRGLHTRRDMYQAEFDRIWEAQRRFHPELLTDAARARIRDLIFFQRELRPPPLSLIGACELEPRLPRCPRADRRAQRLRIHQEVNNLRVIDTSRHTERALTEDERGKLVQLLLATKDLKFDSIRSKLFEQHESIRFNLEEGGRKSLKGMTSDAAVKSTKILGKAWDRLPESTKDRIVAAAIDDDESRVRFLLGESALDSDLAPQLLDRIDFEEGYASYSLHAIKKLLPHVERGLPLTSRDPSVPCALREAGYQMPWDTVVDQRKYLDQPPNVTNPIVRAALHEVRKVINAILRELVYPSGHTLEHIHIELAREARGTAEQRRKYSLEIRKREHERDDAAERIREAGVRPTREAIDRYRLWREQGEICIYCGDSISLAQLLGGEVDVDHILPRSRSLDNSLMNRVVCFRRENAQKGDQTVHEWLADRNPARYEQVLQRARRLPYPKLKRFYQANVTIDDFFARQFVDTTYITTQVRDYVRTLGADIVCVRGQHTAELRWQWGLDTVLRHDDLPIKNREDHRHHAVDAIVIALTNRSRLQQLAAIRRMGGTERTGEILPEPWPSFRADVEATVNAINVSHRTRRRVSGALHDETIYGPTAERNFFVYRKPIETLTTAMIDKIRDPIIRDLVKKRLAAHGISIGRGGGKIPPEVWKDPLTMDSGVPIRKVRLLVPSDSIRPIRAGTAFVQPANLHHICIFDVKNGGPRETRKAIFVSMLDAIDRIRCRKPLIQRNPPEYPNLDFKYSIASNELFLIEHNGKTDLYRFETGASTSHQMWFRHHTFAGPSGSNKTGRISKMPNTLRAQKVTVDTLGRIRRASD